MFSATFFCRPNGAMLRAALLATLFECFVIPSHCQYLLTTPKEQTAATGRPKSMEIGTVPRIYMAVGSSTNLTCSSDQFDSSTFWFLEKSYNKSIRQPSEQIIILNSSTVMLTIQNATESSYEYICMSEQNRLNTTYVHVGRAPSEIRDFYCRVNNFYNMTCSFKDSLFKTDYDICYGFESHQCRLKCKHIIENNRVYCKLNQEDATKNFYVVEKRTYFFHINASNAAGSHSQTVKINNFECVVPAKLDVTLDRLTTNSVRLHWPNANHVYYENVKLVYEICIKPKDLDIRCRTEYLKSKYNNTLIENLEYPGYEYDLSVRAKVESNVNNEWSEPFNTTFRTLSQRPNRPPKTDVGSFYNDSMLHLYWQELKAYEHNGPGFLYIISEDNRDDKFTAETTLSIDWNGYEGRTFYIKSSNAIGYSENSSVIHVPAKRRDDYEPTDVQKIYYENKSYELSWKHPRRRDGLLSYTIFWCNEKRADLQGCKSSINFTHIDKHQTKYTTEPENRLLNLAVSGNYADYNAGMVWASCGAAKSRSLIKPIVEARSLNAASIFLEWNIGYICQSVIDGYTLTYCEVDNIANNTAKCLSASITSGYIQNYTIENLKPYTKYRINMLMFSDERYGPASDDMIVETLEAAPSAPRDLQIDEFSITNTTVDISWLPPEEFNGKIKYYTIIIENLYAKNVSLRVLNATKEVENERINYTINNLNSYTEFKVAVTATTVRRSVQSNPISFKTTIGTPTAPHDVNSYLANGLITWKAPISPAGRLDFYAVMLAFTYKNVTTLETSLVKGNECKFRISFCYDTLFLRVRAINLATNSEINDNINTSMKISQSNDTKLITENEHFNCENAVSLDERYKYYDPNIDGVNIQHHYEKGFSYYASAWRNDQTSYNNGCGLPNWDRNLIAYLFATMILIIFLTFMSHKLFIKYKKMKNIKVQLPDGLSDQHSNSKYPANGNVYDNECTKGITGSNDNLIKNREKSYLLSSNGGGGVPQRQLSTNSENSVSDFSMPYDDGRIVNVERKLSFDNAYNHALDIVDEHLNNSSCDEQYSTRSTDSVEINDVSSLSYNKSTFAQQTEHIIDEIEGENENHEQQQQQQQSKPPVDETKLIISMPKPVPTSNGYVTIPPAIVLSGGYIKSSKVK